ncbi:MAG TPA: M1 family metallopeptidase [Gemmatimonadaceae bacterium]|nr:M1 family metallopeptidase [Gemmatimonadaceae bacterium]
MRLHIRPMLRLLALTLGATALHAQGGQGGADKFRQLGDELPTPNSYRTASGAPGRDYWQNRVDYSIDVTLDDVRQLVTGREAITYHNNSPDTLRFVWVQLDQNIHESSSISNLTRNGRLQPGAAAAGITMLASTDSVPGWIGGYRIASVTTPTGKALPKTIVGTMMRVDLDAPLAPKATRGLVIAWTYPILETRLTNARTGWERFPDGNYSYNVAQWFPRLAVYSDNTGWQHKQFLGSGEFTLPFGNYSVRITVPDGHVVAATGMLTDATTALTATQRARLAAALASDSIRHIVTPDDARTAERGKPRGTRVWAFAATDVRDFAFATSRKFIWDGRGVTIAGKRVLAQSYYPNEANPLWGEYSTRAVAHALVTYSKASIAYPYPQATSVHWNGSGMEYPMICFNPRRPRPDGTYDEATKNGLISVVIHEVGHNFFPMIINSDERQWTWMDEGLNSYTQFLSEQEWDRQYPSRRGPPRNVIDYMRLEKSQQEPVMTNSESVISLGNIAYLKAATALNILRQTVVGDSLFDMAFREYARRWAFKHPAPADFFRTMEDVTAVDLDWYWRGWFYGVDNVNLAIDGSREFRIGADKAVTGDGISAEDRERVTKFMGGLDAANARAVQGAQYVYEVDIANKGGLVMPVILTFVYEDGTSRTVRIPAEIWRVNSSRVTKAFASDRKVTEILLDALEETADTDINDNVWPRRDAQSAFQRFKARAPVP